ncbi:MAG: ATP-binding cassette domain-containing protein, partial [Roseimicrobium sp.]
MLELRNITLTTQRDGETHTLLDDITLNVPPGHLLAIVGPSGCGKTTLMKTIAGLKHHDSGEIHWQGRNVEHEGDLHPSELGFVPQFSIAHDLLTVEECVASAVCLRTRQVDDEATWAVVDKMLEHTGMTKLAERQVKVLSGGQKRRLGLALELVTNPTLLLCDEVTSGLDPKSEREITQLLHDLARQNDKRIVINVTHSLSNLSLFDTVLVLHEGRVVFHGPPRALPHYFSVEHAEDVYPKLARRSAERWGDSWNKHREAYYEAYGLTSNTPDVGKPKVSDHSDPVLVSDRSPERDHLPSAKDLMAEDEAAVRKEEAQPDESDHEEHEGDDWGKHKRRREKKLERQNPSEAAPHQVDEAHQLPGFLAQTRELVSRRWLIFRRDKSQVWLHLAMLFGFPLLVVIFGYEGVPQVRQLSARQDANVLMEFKEQSAHLASQLKSGGLVSGLILMQVVLVTLMASNNAAREIAGERDILERERLGGLRALSYVASKVIFLGAFVLAQALWMGLFVEMLCRGIPGDLFIKLGLLVMASAAMTSVCLGISALMRSPEKATILCIYLVGFQLPLSGAVLALPKAFAPIVQPFIAAYWSWAGSLNTMKTTAFYDAVKKVTESNLEPWNLAVFVLGLHI